MFRLLLLLFFLYPGMLLKAQESSVFLADHPEYPKYLNGMIVSDIIYPGSDFSRIEELGTPVETRYRKVTNRNSWILVFDGFELEYVDLYGEPELHRLYINKPSVVMRYQNVNLAVGKILPIALEDASFDPVSDNLTTEQKYDGTFQFLEVRLGPSSRITEIIYQREVQ